MNSSSCVSTVVWQFAQFWDTSHPLRPLYNLCRNLCTFCHGHLFNESSWWSQYTYDEAAFERIISHKVLDWICRVQSHRVTSFHRHNHNLNLFNPNFVSTTLALGLKWKLSYESTHRDSTMTHSKFTIKKNRLSFWKFHVQRHYYLQYPFQESFRFMRFFNRFVTFWALLSCLMWRTESAPLGLRYWWKSLFVPNQNQFHS